MGMCVVLYISTLRDNRSRSNTLIPLSQKTLPFDLVAEVRLSKVPGTPGLQEPRPPDVELHFGDNLEVMDMVHIADKF